MERPVDAAYGLGRLAFGAGLMAAPESLGNVLIGEDAREPAVRANFRFYGTRDVVLGLGTLRAVGEGSDTGPWLAAGIASDVLDAAMIAAEWNTIPPGKRVPGVLSALGAAAAGLVLLARR